MLRFGLIDEMVGEQERELEPEAEEGEGERSGRERGGRGRREHTKKSKKLSELVVSDSLNLCATHQ